MTAIGSLVSVLFVGIGLYITNEANREQQRLTEKGQITERFTKAVEQLGQSGPDKIDVRLGAIYALERIMRDSAVDHPAIVQLLAAFVRVHSPVPTPSPSQPEDLAEPTPPPPLPVDIQAALTVLGRRDVSRDGNYEISLARTDLRGADLSHTNLRLVDLSGADLSGANLLGTDLSAADLRGANLIGADLRGAYLDHAFLSNADLRYADLASAELRNADLFDAKLADADLRNADLSGASGVTGEGFRFACIGFGTTMPSGVVVEGPPAGERKAHCRPPGWKLLPPSSQTELSGFLEK